MSLFVNCWPKEKSNYYKYVVSARSVVVHTFNTSVLESRGRWISEFKVRLFCRDRSRAAGWHRETLSWIKQTKKKYRQKGRKEDKRKKENWKYDKSALSLRLLLILNGAPSLTFPTLRDFAWAQLCCDHLKRLPLHSALFQEEKLGAQLQGAVSVHDSQYHCADFLNGISRAKWHLLIAGRLM